MKKTEATKGDRGVHSLLIEMGVLRKGIRKKVRFDQRPEQTEGTLHVCISGGRAARADQTASTEPLRQGCARLDRERDKEACVARAEWARKRKVWRAVESDSADAR